MTDTNTNDDKADIVDDARRELAAQLRDRVDDLDRELDAGSDDSRVWAYNQLVETYRRVLKDIEDSQAEGVDDDEQPIWKQLDDEFGGPEVDS